MKAVNEASGKAFALWITFLTVGTYLAIAIGATTHLQLLLAGPVKLPLLGVDMPLFAFYGFAPPMFVVLHLYVLMQLYLLARLLRLFDDRLQSARMLEQDRRMIRGQLDKFVFTQFLIGAPQDGVVRLFLRAVVWLSFVAGPIEKVESWRAIRFLGCAMTKPYSADLRVRVVEAVDEGATRQEAAERFGVSVSSAVRWHQAWRYEGTIEAKPYGGSRSPLEDHAEEILTVTEEQPDLTLDEIVAVMRKRKIPEPQSNRAIVQQLQGIPAQVRRAHRKGTSPPHRTVRATIARRSLRQLLRSRGICCNMTGIRSSRSLSLSGGERLVEPDEDKLSKLSRTLFLNHHDLRDADFTGSDLRKADLSLANLSGADLSTANLRFAYMSGTDLSRANLSNANLSGADLSRANPRDAKGLTQIQLDAACGTDTKLPPGRTLKPCPQ